MFISRFLIQILHTIQNVHEGIHEYHKEEYSKDLGPNYVQEFGPCTITYCTFGNNDLNNLVFLDR
jgi:hypothetical protein